jgi:hypothetical protein
MNTKIIFPALFIFVLIIWLAYPFIISWHVVADLFPKIGWASRGVVGDSFGALNTLFSGLAVAGLIYTILLQQYQINETNKEYTRNAKAQGHAAKLNALTVLFAEYKHLEELKEQEYDRAIKAPTIPGGSTDLIQAIREELDNILQKKHKIFKELEETAGL